MPSCMSVVVHCVPPGNAVLRCDTRCRDGRERWPAEIPADVFPFGGRLALFYSAEMAHEVPHPTREYLRYALCRPRRGVHSPGAANALHALFR